MDIREDWMFEKKDNKCDRDKQQISRRKCLRTAVTSGTLIAVGGTGLTTTSIADDKNSNLDTVYREALEVREETDSREAFLEVLNDSNLEVKNESDRHNIRELTDGGGYLSKEELGKREFEHSYTLTYSCDEDAVWADYEWEHSKVCTAGSASGEDPHDVAAITWSDTEYTRLSHYTGNSNTLVGTHHGDYKDNGIACEYDDKQETIDETNNGYDCPTTIGSYMGTKAGIKDDSDPASWRSIIFDYQHNYASTSCGINSIGITSTGGFTVIFSCSSNVDSWPAQAELSEDEVTGSCRNY